MFDTLQTIALQSDGAGAALGIVFLLIYFAFLFAIALIPLAGLCKIFSKAGEPWWAALVPIYNLIVMLKITDNPIWYVIPALIPLINLLVLAKVYIDLAEAFGKGVGYALGMLFLSPIFIPLLGFGSAQYRGGRGRAGGRRQQQARRPRR